MRKKIARMVIAGLFFTATVQCKEAVNCSDPKGGYEETECSRLKHAEADKALNEAYKKVKSKVGKEQAKILLAAQKGWLQLRDNQCALEVFAIRGTTGYNAEYSECLAKLTELRTKQIESTPTDSTMN